MTKRQPKGNGQTRSKARRVKPITQAAAARSNGHGLVVAEGRSRPADNWLARLKALDCEAVSRRIASCERPQELKTLLDEIKIAQQASAKFLAEHYELRVKLFRVEVQATRKLQGLIEQIPTVAGPGRGKRISSEGKLFELDRLGITRKQAYEYRDLRELPQAEIDSYEAACRAEHQVPTRSGLLNAIRKRQMLERNVRDRPWTEDRGGLFGCDASEGDPSQAAMAHETIRQFCEEDSLAHVAAILDERSESGCRLIESLIHHRRLRDFVQGYYERRGRPAEQRRFIAQLIQLMAAAEAESNAPTNSSERDETTRAVAIPAGTTDAATVN
jgi:hypothetical protein